MVVKNDIFWSEIGSGFEKLGGKRALRIPPEYPPPDHHLIEQIKNISNKENL